MNERIQILLVDDDEEEYVLLKAMVSQAPKRPALWKFDLDWVGTYEQALAAFSECRHHLYLVDYRLGKRNGLDLLHEASARGCQAPIIILTGQGNYEIDLAAMQSGAADYLVKGQLTLPLLERSIRYAIERKQVQKDLERLVQERTHDLALLRRQANELSALHKATTSLLSTLDMNTLVSQILDAAQEAIPAAERSWLHLVDPHDNRVNPLDETGLGNARIRSLDLPVGGQSSLASLHEGHPLLVEDVQGEPALQGFLENDLSPNTVRSAVIVPLILGQAIFGALTLCASKPAAFSETDLDLLTSFAATATAAMQNALLYAEVQYLATTDALTGQLNRRALFELGQREFDRSQRFGHPLAAMMFDVDHFKQINDSYGHATGDQVLVAVVERTCQVIRRVDILGRYGGDEFAILLPEADQPVARKIAQRVRISVSESPVITDVGPVSVSTSIGIAQANQDTANLDILLNRADQALLQSKQAGRNRIEGG